MNLASSKHQEVYISISQLTRLLNQTLEECFPSLLFSGEISQITRAGSGHIYFTLKDEASQVSAVMWKGMAANLGFMPEQGNFVHCQGRPNVYSKNGRLQIVVSSMRQAGEGLLQQKYLQLKAKLEKEGFFSADRKRVIPFFPKTVGVVTSGSGAALHDILVKIRERMPATKVVLADVRVQGEGSALEIAAGIEILNQRSDIETIIVGRGGGSLEDLWAFNEEVVVKAVFKSRIPIVCAVGHEIDVCLAELTADQRAPTPTAAAEMVVPHKDILARQINELSRRLSDTDRWFQTFTQGLDSLSESLLRGIALVFDKSKTDLDRMSALVKLLEPKKLLDRFESEVSLFAHRLNSSYAGAIKERKSVLDRLYATLESLSHQKVLARGYAIVTHKKKLLTSSSKVSKDDLVEIDLHKGSINAKVIKIY